MNWKTPLGLLFVVVGPAVPFGPVAAIAYYYPLLGSSLILASLVSLVVGGYLWGRDRGVRAFVILIAPFLSTVSLEVVACSVVVCSTHAGIGLISLPFFYVFLTSVGVGFGILVRHMATRNTRSRSSSAQQEPIP